ncbi:MAG: hypothetical protein HYX76_00220 [Acidobacteria bacterium]|nr:hypothetical protein [Acidobacteriota bacterium]
MINYTEHLTRLMRDLVARVPGLGFIDPSDVLMFARFGRSEASGAFATCHCLTLPTSEPGYYFWRDRVTGRLTRRSQWFVTKSPEVRIGDQRIKYLVSFVLPRFCDQSLEYSRKREHYRGAEPWLAKLDTVVHELYHIDPDDSGLRKIERADGSYSPRSHGPAFYYDVANMVSMYLSTNPDPTMYDFLRHDFNALQKRFGGLLATTFRNFPSFPQRYIEATPDQQPEGADVAIEPLKAPSQPALYTEEDLLTRQFFAESARLPAVDRAA